ncbi:MAG: histidinol dehydrogenase [Syntrophales bacterium]|nr:histidinol dehydrogenase [Syntrophales bacterium]
MKLIKTDSSDFGVFFRALVERRDIIFGDVLSQVEEIVREVAVKGDAALFDYTLRFEGHYIDSRSVLCSKEELNYLASRLSTEDREILELAASRIRKYHCHQVEKNWVYEDDGILLGQRIVPLNRVGIYVPGGLASYPSTLLMAAIPARVAGVNEIIVCSPVRGEEVDPYVAYAALLVEVDAFFKVGGAQAVAAMAFGTESIPRVDKIVGPGNVYVAAAKKVVFGAVDIDSIAGPSEVLIIGDGTSPPSYAAADLIAQAEHDERACAVLLTPSEAYAMDVLKEVKRQLESLKCDVARRSLERYGALIVTRDLTEAMALANDFAPEHLELLVDHPEELLSCVRSAGAVFLGSWTPEVLGDYLAGPNHILPTAGSARFSSPLGVYDFVKRISVLSFSENAFRMYGPKAERFAKIEGLSGHAGAAKVRLCGKNLDK